MRIIFQLKIYLGGKNTFLIKKMIYKMPLKIGKHPPISYFWGFQLRKNPENNEKGFFLYLLI